jgi:hypothetical protein
MEYYKRINKPMNFDLYDINEVIVRLLNMLKNNQLEEILDDPVYNNFNNILRFNVDEKDKRIERPKQKKKKTPDDIIKERNRRRDILKNCYELMSFHSVVIENRNCLDIAFDDDCLLLIDPPYFGKLVKYVGETITIADYAILFDYITENNFKFILFNDELACYLKWFCNCHQEVYVIKRGGICKSRTEVMITNLIPKA